MADFSGEPFPLMTYGEGGVRGGQTTAACIVSSSYSMNLLVTRNAAFDLAVEYIYHLKYWNLQNGDF